MSAYNTVTINWKDCNPEQEHTITIQFKYGEVWQHNYKIGDDLKWGNNDIGDPFAKKVVVEGVLEGEKLSKNMPEDFEIYIEDNQIKSVVPSTQKYNFLESENDYIILE